MSNPAQVANFVRKLALAGDVADQHALVLGRAQGRAFARQGGDHLAIQRVADFIDADGLEQAALHAVGDDLELSPAKPDRAQQIEPAARLAQAGDRQFGDQHHFVRSDHGRQRPVGPHRGQIDQHMAEMAAGEGQHPQQLIDIDGIERGDRLGRGDDRIAIARLGDRAAQQLAIQPFAGIEQRRDRHLGLHPGIGRDIAALQVEIDHADAFSCRALARHRRGEVGDQGRGAAAAGAARHRDHRCEVARVAGFGQPGRGVEDLRGEFFGGEGQFGDIGDALADQCAHQRDIGLAQRGDDRQISRSARSLAIRRSDSARSDRLRAPALSPPGDSPDSSSCAACGMKVPRQPSACREARRLATSPGLATMNSLPEDRSHTGVKFKWFFMIPHGYA